MLEDLLNSMQNHEDWRGQAMHGHQEAGAAAAATAPVFFSEWAMNVTYFSWLWNSNLSPHHSRRWASSTMTSSSLRPSTSVWVPPYGSV